MASSEIAKHARAVAHNNVHRCIVLFNNLISRANMSFYCVAIVHAITLLLLSERYIILMSILAYTPIYRRGL